jgi:hypothetical protein
MKLTQDELEFLSAWARERAVRIVQEIPMTDEEIDNGTWEENAERQDGLSECDALYFEGPENIEESLFAFIKANRAKIEP